jgi:hypothetical protein
VEVAVTHCLKTVNPNFISRSAGTSAASSSRPTMTDAAAPNLTRREADVLVALCWRVLHGEPFAQTAEASA